MINISSHLVTNYDDAGYEDCKKPLTINCCGYQVFDTKDFEKVRPNGRMDYQIIYVSKGFIHYKEKNTWRTCSEGHIVIYKPHESQHYRYYHSDNTEVFWIHFTGYLANEIIDNFEAPCDYIGRNPELASIFQAIISELQIKKSGFSQVITGLFYQIIGGLLRTKMAQNVESNSKILIEQLIVHLNKYYMDPWTIESMACHCNLSEYYFSRYFKSITDFSPIQYLTQLRLSKAKNLLEETSHPISEVALLVGYKDSLYFSRVFKKHFGISPKSYKANNNQASPK